MSDLFAQIKSALNGEKISIVLPEGTDERIVKAASQLAGEQLVRPILLGCPIEIKKKADSLAASLDGVDIVNPREYEEIEQMVHAFVERRKGKETIESAAQKLTDVNYFGTMLVYMKKADGLVSGAVHSTGDTVRPALQIIKTKQGMKRTSGVFIMVKGEKTYLFSDCAINISPASEELAEIAVATADTAKEFGIDPKVAMLSFSTKGSAISPETVKVRDAAVLASEARPDLIIEGEFQFDAAIIPEVAEKKAPQSLLRGEANVFIFPTLEAGNIGYKIAERLGGYEAIGPILQGLNRPVNDLSRGCTTEDVYKLTLITALQSLRGRMNDNEL